MIDQTASRSTELACHDRVFAYHDFRNTVVFTTVSQAQERVNHYEQRYSGFQPIIVYGHKKTFELSAGLIDYTEYMTTHWKKRKIDSRTTTRLGLHGDYYHILNTSDNSVHPDHSEPLVLDAAETILQQLSSLVDIKVSARVHGRSDRKPIFGCEFVACTPGEFASKKVSIDYKADHNFDDPFTDSEKKGRSEDGRFKGFLREWKVWDFAEIRDDERGWGVGGTARMTICYNEGVLGVAVRWNTGRKQEVSTLETCKSMYKH